jgi:hypothetical protein
MPTMVAIGLMIEEEEHPLALKRILAGRPCSDSALGPQEKVVVVVAKAVGMGKCTIPRRPSVTRPAAMARSMQRSLRAVRFAQYLLASCLGTLIDFPLHLFKRSGL